MQRITAPPATGRWPLPVSWPPVTSKCWWSAYWPIRSARSKSRTAAHGFAGVWAAVVADFVERQSPGGLKFSINDGGARPDTVSHSPGAGRAHGRGGGLMSTSSAQTAQPSFGGAS